ncbi:VWA domain-containing protein [Acidipila sp. EB88]|uniref:VWA domain-containing protein n=1 Tax=Acidipila sp. EB88 TaxID=2305226 RepID=UPI000F5F12E2|nr:VWA domain-containing protein [Acidipila sp. EB88]RRA49669.1 VWA domain-containing protein [Acidipila sp. EB88]
MSRRVLLPFLLSALCLPSALAVAQQPPQPAPAPDANTIRLNVVVAPSKGAPIAGLHQQDFTVFDNKSPQTITGFHAYTGPNAPVEVILVIDAVNTSYITIAYEREQIGKFLEANGGHLAHPTALAVFSDRGNQVQQGFTTDGNAVNTALKSFTIGLRDIRRSAGIYGADDRLQLSLTALQQLAARESARPGRKLVLWLSPGWPILSGPAIQLTNKQQDALFRTAADVSTQLRQAQITLYALNPLGVGESLGRSLYYEEFLKGVDKPSNMQIGNLALQVLAVQSGGLALNSTGVADLLQRSVADAENYYELDFSPIPGEPDHPYHQVDVKVTEGGVEARARTGYYARP